MHPHLSGFLAVLASVSAAAQVSPAHPNGFKTRPIGDALGGAVEVIPRDAPAKVRQVTYLVLSDMREWTSSEGQPSRGKLIAFEDLVVSQPAREGHAAQATAPPAHPSVVAGGKVRLLVNQKPFEVALARLSLADREFIEKTRVFHAKKPGAPAEPGA